MDNDIYVLVDEPVKGDDEIMKAIVKHMKTKQLEAPVIVDSYGDLSIYSQGLSTFMSPEAQSQLYGDGSVSKSKKQPIKKKLLLALASQPDAWLSVKEVAAIAGVKVKGAQEGLKDLYAQQAVSRRFMDDNAVRKGFVWRHQDQAEQVAAVTDAEFDEPERTELESMQVEQEIAAAVEQESVAWAQEAVAQESKQEVPSKADAKPDYAVFLTTQGQEQVGAATTLQGSLETVPEVHVEQDQQELSDAEVKADLEGIFQDDYFARLVNRVVLDGPARINRKITILRTLSLLLSKHSRGMDYGKELMEVAEYLASIDELQHYY